MKLCLVSIVIGVMTWATGPGELTVLVGDEFAVRAAVEPEVTQLGEDGEVIVSYALITINANAHALMNRYGHPGNDKAMPAILNEGAYDAWLNAKVNKAKEFLRPYPAEKLRANPVEKGRKQPPPQW